ncbi:unnamed protein product [Amoebophrya sp. A120]|nr:unnamed protein product [Amoebophrya sp. A120]|eukprot:GSA120T00004018001.1
MIPTRSGSPKTNMNSLNPATMNSQHHLLLTEQDQQGVVDDANLHNNMQQQIPHQLLAQNQNRDHGASASRPPGPRSEVTFSSVSSDDSLPLGCEHNEYFWIKRYRALKRRVSANKVRQTGENLQEAPILEEEEEGAGSPLGGGVAAAPDQLTNNLLPNRLKRLPCTRFYMEESRQDPFTDFVHSEFLAAVVSSAADLHQSAAQQTSPPSMNLLGCGMANKSRMALLRTQDSLLISAVSSRWFVVDVFSGIVPTGAAVTLQQQQSGGAGKKKLLVGVTRSPQQQPCDLLDTKLVTLGEELFTSHSAGVGSSSSSTSRVKLLVTPALESPQTSKYVPGDITVFVNDQKVAEKIEHGFSCDQELFGLAVVSRSNSMCPDMILLCNKKELQFQFESSSCARSMKMHLQDVATTYWSDHREVQREREALRCCCSSRTSQLEICSSCCIKLKMCIQDEGTGREFQNSASSGQKF